jgi:hypothetical protein
MLHKKTGFQSGSLFYFCALLSPIVRYSIGGAFYKQFALYRVGIYGNTCTAIKQRFYSFINLSDWLLVLAMVPRR